uniref:multiple C2 and transmembrane domain-containing protein 1-like isoform X2 n=1 Tax=Ciona intestinalis TaxID=7719 RepID=UPI000EF47025|nr:multiple C2 and transmembrane domain-containing protein 1-like isoform X2 [Ciona intestinalis]|eukprot:XP_026694109.1 multiple C2 and transmembrane domain-containing protein 1-like isoform X2 [Ciona intestinalis]
MEDRENNIVEYDRLSLQDSSDNGSPNRKGKKGKKLGIFSYRSRKTERKKEHFVNGDFQKEEISSTYTEVTQESIHSTHITQRARTGSHLHRSPAKDDRKPPTHKLHIKLIGGEGLAARDSNGLSDPYVKIRINNRTVYKSKCCKLTLDPRWDEDFAIEVDMEAHVVLHVYDKDRGFTDDFMGAAEIDLATLTQNPEEINLHLSDESSEEELGYINIHGHLTSVNHEVPALQPQPIKEEVITQAETPVLSAKKDFGTMKRNQGSVRGTRHLFPVAIATVQLVSGSNLPARDANGFSDPYVKLMLGKWKKKSKVCYKTLNPLWKEEFTIQLCNKETSMLDVTVWDKDSYRKDDFIGRCDLDLWNLEREVTHSLKLNLLDTTGSLLFLITVHGVDAGENTLTSYDLGNLRSRYNKMKTFEDLSDIGFAEIKIISASGLRAADINGKSDPFCVVQLCNARAQTQTCYKTLDPVWNRVFTFPIKDVHDVFELFIFDSDNVTDREFLGRASIPLLNAVNGEEHVYALKDRKLRERTKGNVTIQISYIYNPIRAAIRTFTPREEKYMEEDCKFKKALLLNNFQRVWRLVQSIIATAEFVNSCFTWKNPRRSGIAFLAFLVIVWNFELYMLPISLLMLIMKTYVDVFVRRQPLAAVESGKYNDDDDETEDEPNKPSLMQRISALQDVLTKVQNILDYISSFGERVKNTFSWRVPFLSWLAVCIFCLVALVLYLFPLRAIVLLWGINKFTKRLRKPDFVPNNEVMDFLSRVPSHVQIDDFREIPIEQGSPRSSKKKR